VSLYPRGRTDRARLEITRNTLVSQAVVVCYLLRTDPGREPMEVHVAGNVLDRQHSSLDFQQRGEFLKENQALPLLPAERLLKRLVTWRERSNLRSVNLRFLDLSAEGVFRTPAPSVKTLGDWKAFWQLADLDHREGQVQYQTVDLLVKLTHAPEQVTAEDFRLAAGSPGKGAGEGGKDLGADVDLVGPGPAYERWKQTPECQQWLKDTGAEKPGG
jgi:hypothetical protein